MTSRDKKASRAPDSKNETLKLVRVDVDTTASDKKGMAGAMESTLRNFKVLGHAVLMLPLYAFSVFVMGLAVWPAVILVAKVSEATQGLASYLQWFFTGTGLIAGYFIYGFTLLGVLPVVNWVLRVRLSEWRGPYYSLATIKWYVHNGLTYLARYTFLEFVTPTPFNILFYKAMGMKIGRDVAINSTCISDPSLISIGDKTTIGGSVAIVGHYGQGGYLVLAPVIIGSRVTIGLRATVMGGAVIGDNAKIMPNSVVMPKTVIPAGETWGGVPAQRIEGNSSLSWKRRA